MKNIIKFLIVASGTAIGTGSNFLIQMLLANKLTVGDYGSLTSLLNVVNLLVPLIAFGVTGYLLKCYVEEGENTKKWYNSIILFNLITIIFAFIIFYLVLSGIYDYFLIILFFIYMVSISLNNFTLLRFQLGGNFKYYAFWVAFPNLSRFLFLIVFLFLVDFNLKTIALIFSISALITLLYSIYSLFLMRKGKVDIKYKNLEEKNGERNLISLLKNSYPYGLSGIFYIIYYQIDIFILKYYVSYEDIAHYGVSLIFISAICLLPSIFYQQVFMPKIHYWAINNKKYLEFFYKRNLVYSLILGIIFYIAINLTISVIVKFIFNDKYVGILDFFYLLSLIIPIKFLSQSAGAIMNIGSWIKMKVYIMGLATVINVFFNLFLIKSFGLHGAIYSTIATEVFLMVCFLIFLKLNFGKDNG